MKREDVCLVFAFFPTAVPCIGGLLITETKTATSIEQVDKEISYGRTDDLLGIMIGTMNDKKSVDEKIFPEKINN